MKKTGECTCQPINPLGTLSHCSQMRKVCPSIKRILSIFLRNLKYLYKFYPRSIFKKSFPKGLLPTDSNITKYALERVVEIGIKEHNCFSRLRAVNFVCDINDVQKTTLMASLLCTYLSVQNDTLIEGLWRHMCALVLLFI